MTQTLASAMARKSLAVFRERVDQKDDFTPDQARELIASCVIPIQILERLWQLAQGFVDRGMEAKQLGFLLKECVDILDVGCKAFDAARSRLYAADITPNERAEGTAMLERASLRAAEMRDELSALLRRLEAPTRKVDPETLPVGRGDRNAQGYIGLDDVVARLNAPKGS